MLGRLEGSFLRCKISVCQYRLSGSRSRSDDLRRMRDARKSWSEAAHGNRRTRRRSGVGKRCPTFRVTASLLKRLQSDLEALRRIDLHFHDLRREGGSRWLDGGVPLHRIKQWLGQANIWQTSAYLEAEAADNDETMRRYKERLLHRIATNFRKGDQTPLPMEMVVNKKVLSGRIGDSFFGLHQARSRRTSRHRRFWLGHRFWRAWVRCGDS
jgi:hypothetical protein